MTLPRRAHSAVFVVLGLSMAAACGDTEPGSPNPGQLAGSSGASGAGTSQAGSSVGGDPEPGAGGDGPVAGNATAGNSAGDAAAGAGGSTGSSEGGASGMAPVGEAGAGGVCSQPCTTNEAGQFCGQNAVTWVCNSLGFDVELFNQECQDAGTGAIRYCCPPAFTGECP